MFILTFIHSCKSNSLIAYFLTNYFSFVHSQIGLSQILCQPFFVFSFNITVLYRIKNNACRLDVNKSSTQRTIQCNQEACYLATNNIFVSGETYTTVDVGNKVKIDRWYLIMIFNRIKVVIFQLCSNKKFLYKALIFACLLKFANSYSDFSDHREHTSNLTNITLEV